MEAARPLREWRQQLAAQLGTLSAAPELEAERWLCRSLGWPRARLFARLDEALPLPLDAALWSRRLSGEPEAYLCAEAHFYGLALQVDPRVLIPRPDTECLVDIALGLPGLPAGSQVLDLGTGSGAIALTLASERPDWQITATDASPAALEVAKGNARRLGVKVDFLHSDWWQGLPPTARWTLIVSNPPYIAEADPHLAELQHEPHSALVAADQGLADLRQLCAGAPKHLQPRGWVLLEHGADQGPAVRELLLSQGFAEVRTEQDHAGHDRVSLGRWHG